jgi:hypothetical protein
MLVTAVTLGVWIATGRHFYTKFEVVENVESPAETEDPLAGTGFYDDDDAVPRTVRRDEFHLGLLPTPQGVLDKHWLSVASVLGGIWALLLFSGWAARRRRRVEARVE